MAIAVLGAACRARRLQLERRQRQQVVRGRARQLVAQPGGGEFLRSRRRRAATGGTVDGKGAKVGIILPDTMSSPRWVTADPTALKADCKTYNLNCDIQNADGSAAKMKTIAQQMEASGVKVLMIVDLDAASGAAIEQQAKKAGVIPVDYDRLTPGGGAALYVSFDNVKVGQVQGTALTQCPQVKGQKCGPVRRHRRCPDRQQRDAVRAGLRRRARQDRRAGRASRKQTGQWDAPTAGRVFNSMLVAAPEHQGRHGRQRHDGRRGHHRPQASGPERQGRRLRSGRQRGRPAGRSWPATSASRSTSRPRLEADPAIKAIAQLVNGQAPDTKGVTIDGPEDQEAKVPAILATPIAVTKANVAQPINDQYTPKNTVCTGKYAALCTKAGVK